MVADYGLKAPNGLMCIPIPTKKTEGKMQSVSLTEESLERRAFEAHAPMNTARREDFPDVYADAFVQASWCGWQARARADAEEWLLATELSRF